MSIRLLQGRGSQGRPVYTRECSGHLQGQHCKRVVILNTKQHNSYQLTHTDTRLLPPPWATMLQDGQLEYARTQLETALEVLHRAAPLGEEATAAHYHYQLGRCVWGRRGGGGALWRREGL